MPNNLKNQDSDLSRYSSDSVVQGLQLHIAALLTLTAGLAEKLKLNLNDVAALEHLGTAPEGLSAGELGRQLRLSTGAITALSDRLARAGYLTREPDPRDRRRLLLSLTPYGQKTGQENLEPVLEGVRQLASALTEEERGTVARFLQASARLLREHQPSAAP